MINSNDKDIIILADMFQPMNHLSPPSSSDDSSTLVGGCDSSQSSSRETAKASTMTRRIASKIPVLAMSSRTLPVSFTASRLPAVPGMGHAAIHCRKLMPQMSANALQVTTSKAVASDSTVAAIVTAASAYAVSVPATSGHNVKKQTKTAVLSSLLVNAKEIVRSEWDKRKDAIESSTLMH